MQDNYLKNNHTGEHSMHSEGIIMKTKLIYLSHNYALEFRLDSNEPEGIDHKQQLKPGT